MLALYAREHDPRPECRALVRRPSQVPGHSSACATITVSSLNVTAGPSCKRYPRAIASLTRRQKAACCAMASAAGLQRDAVPLCPAMPQFHIETFRAQVMIVASSGRYLPVSGHDHETARAGGASLSSPAVPAATDHTVNVASISRRRAELARWLWDLSKTSLLVWLPREWPLRASMFPQIRVRR